MALAWFALESRTLPCEPCRCFTSELFVRFVRSAQPETKPATSSLVDMVFDQFQIIRAKVVAQQGGTHASRASRPERSRYHLARRLVCGGTTEPSSKSLCRLHMCEAIAGVTQSTGPSQATRALCIVAMLQLEGWLLAKSRPGFAAACERECSASMDKLRDPSNAVDPWKWAFLCAYKVGVSLEDGIVASASTELQRMLQGVGRLHEWLIR